MSRLEDLILPRLERVRRRGQGEFSASCSAHDDSGPSLALKELPDGRILMHCFAGCSVDEIVGALGLNLSDLFPPRDVQAGPVTPRRLIGASQALELLHAESQLVALAASNLSNGLELTQDDLQRVLDAAGRIAYLHTEVCS